MIGQDGVHKSPITFPRGGHLLAFLSCLENGLMPYGQLDPPLWSQKGKGLYTTFRYFLELERDERASRGRRQVGEGSKKRKAGKTI